MRLVKMVRRFEKIRVQSIVAVTRADSSLESVELVCWILTLALMAIGLLGTVLPVLPGPALIFGAAVIHRLILGPEKGLGSPGLAVLFLLCLTTIAIDFLGGWLGARRFGATRWGTWGAISGAFVGLFFGLPGIFAGPVIGAFAGELIGGKRLVDAGLAGWGALLGNLTAVVGKLVIALAMVGWFLITAAAPF